MASKPRDDLKEILLQMKHQVRKAMDKNGSARQEVEQHVTDLQRKVGEFRNNANKIFDENLAMLQSLDEQLVNCTSELLKKSANNTEKDDGHNTTDAEKCTSGESESGDHCGTSNTPTDQVDRNTNEQLIFCSKPRNDSQSSCQLSYNYVDSPRVQRFKLPASKKKDYELAWNRIKLAQLTHQKDDGTECVIKEVEVKTVDGYGEENERFKYPYHLVNGPSNELIISDRDNHQLIVFNEKLQFLYAFGGKGVGKGTFYNPAGLAVDRTNNILYVADRNNLIQQLKINENSSCHFISQFGKKGIGKGQFNCPHGLVFTQFNELFVCDYRNHRIQVFEKDGKFLHAFGRHGTKPGEFNEPHAISVNNCGNKVFVSDHSNNRIQCFNQHGKFLLVIENGKSLNQRLQFPRGIFCTPGGHLLVSCTHTHCILELKEDGSYVANIEEIIQPCGIVLRHNGDVMVTSNVNQSLVIFRGCNVDS